MSTVAYITTRGLFGRRRALLLLPLPVLLGGLALSCRGYDVNPADWGTPVIVGLGLAVVLPVIALIVGTGVLGFVVVVGLFVFFLFLLLLWWFFFWRPTRTGGSPSCVPPSPLARTAERRSHAGWSGLWRHWGTEQATLRRSLAGLQWRQRS